MNQPPPHGWHQQPPPPPGWPQQQPQGWPQPPKKSKAPLIIGIVVGLLLAGGGITALAVYLNVNADGGSSRRSDQLPLMCRNISETALAKARTTNPNRLSSRETTLSNGKRTSCSWNQTKGTDGSGLRSTDVVVSSEQKDAEVDFDRMVAQRMANNQGTPQQKPLDRLGDEATAVLVETKSAFTEISIIVRKDDSVVEVDHSGWDAGVFTNKKPDVAELEAAATRMAQEMVTKL